MSLYLAVGLLRLQDDAAAGVRVVLGADFVFVSVDVVDVHAFFPLVVYFSNGDQLHCLPLRHRCRGTLVEKVNFMGNSHVCF